MSRVGVANTYRFERYAARSGEAGVRTFSVGRDFIIVEFKDGRCYRYDAVRPGARAVSQMVRLARRGWGLTTYINQYVRENYAARLDR